MISESTTFSRHATHHTILAFSLQSNMYPPSKETKLILALEALENDEILSLRSSSASLCLCVKLTAAEHTHHQIH